MNHFVYCIQKYTSLYVKGFSCQGFFCGAANKEKPYGITRDFASESNPMQKFHYPHPEIVEGTRRGPLPSMEREGGKVFST